MRNGVSWTRRTTARGQHAGSNPGSPQQVAYLPLGDGAASSGLFVYRCSLGMSRLAGLA